MSLIVFEDAGYENLLPLVYVRGVFDLRCGFDSLLDKIETAFDQTASALFVRPALAAVLTERQSRPVNQTPDGDDQLWINGRLLVRERFDLPVNTAVWRGDVLLAARVDSRLAATLSAEMLLDAAKLKAAFDGCQSADIPAEAACLIDYPWQLVHQNEPEIIRQFSALSAGLIGRVDPGAVLLNEAAVHLAAGSRVKPGVVLDAENGPIVIDGNVTLSPNVTITGPVHIADHCLIQPGASIRQGTSIGPFCKIGGEVEGSIFHGFSNKQHDGFVGHSYIAPWVNLGADTVTSDLKNTYGPIRVPINGRQVDSGEMFIGAIIGDHAKTGIHTALPTGCVIGFASNVFLSEYPPKFIPSFSWMTDDGDEINDPQRALAVAHKVVSRRKQTMTSAEESLFLSIAEVSQQCETSLGNGE